MNVKLPYELRARFTKLLNHLHLNNQNQLEPIRVPVLSRVWYKLDPEHSENSETALDNLKNFVKDYLISCQGVQKAFEKHKNEMTLEILNLSEALIINGVYIDDQELIALIDPMITLLDGSKDVSTKREESVNGDSGMSFQSSMNLSGKGQQTSRRHKTRYELNEQNLSVMECKSKICDILAVVMDMQLNNRITTFLLEFKKNIETFMDEDNEPKSPDRKRSSVKPGTIQKMETSLNF